MLSSLRESDIREALQDAGESVGYNGVSSFGILDISDSLESLNDDSMAQTKVTTCLVQSSVFSDLRVDGKIVVAGQSYRIDRVAPEDDGALTRLYLARMT